MNEAAAHELAPREHSPIIARHGNIVLLTLSRPSVLNVIDRRSRDGIRRELAAAAADPTVAGVVITGAGRAFTAGQDVGELADLDAAGARSWIRDLGSLYGSVRDFPKPLVAAVNGVAAGAGLQIALHADLRIGCEASVMAQTEIDIGLPSVLGPWVMNRIMGIGPTLEMSLTGRRVPSDEALRLGMLNRIVAADDLMRVAIETALALADKPPRAIEMTKQWVAALDGQSWTDAVEAASDIMAAAFASGEPQDMIRQFRDRRGKQR